MPFIDENLTPKRQYEKLNLQAQLNITCLTAPTNIRSDFLLFSVSKSIASILSPVISICPSAI